MQNDQLKAMIEIGQSVSTSSATPQQAYNEIVRNREVMPQATGAVIEVIDGDMLRYAAARDDRIDVKDFSLPLAGSLSGLAIMSGAALICHDAEEDSRVDIEACRRVGLSSMIVTPIPYRGSYIGVLKFYSDQKNSFVEFDRIISQLLVGIITMILSRISEAHALEKQGELTNAAKEKQEFISMLTHELKTPLTSILGALPFVEDSIQNNECDAADRFLQIAIRNAIRLQSFVYDLMDIHQIEEGALPLNIVHIDLISMLKSVIADLSPVSHAKDVKYEIVAPIDRLSVQTDQDRLSRVVINVLSNALRFSANGGGITIRVDKIEDFALIAIEDEGPGVPIEFRDVMFSRYSRVDKQPSQTNYKGSGLGLFICKKIMKELNGSIELDQSYEDGAKFVLKIPICITY